MTCQHCKYHKDRAARWRAEAYKQHGHEVELPWVGLTDEEVDAESAKEEQAYGFVQGAIWAEAKLKEKNT